MFVANDFGYIKRNYEKNLKENSNERIKIT